MKNRPKRILAFVLALLLGLPTIATISRQEAKADNVSKTITVHGGKNINDMKYRGNNVLSSSAWWYDEDGNQIPAFCVDPNKAGPGEMSAKKYDVKITSAETNEKMAAILNNSIPYKTPAELGVSSMEEAYAATKAAIWCVLDIGSYSNRNLWTSDNSNVEALFNKLVDAALNNPPAVVPARYGTVAVDETVQKDDIHYYQRFRVAETSNSGKDIISYTVELTGNYPDGTIITDDNGTPKNTFGGT